MDQRQAEEERKKAILTKVSEQAKYKLDKIVPIRELYRRPDCEEFMLRNSSTGTAISMLSKAESQLLTKLHIPGHYLHRCSNRLQAENVNEWIERQASDKDILLRMMMSEDQLNLQNGPVKPEDYTLLPEASSVRAIFSDKYGYIDDSFLIPIAINALQELDTKENLHLKYFHTDWNFSLLRVVYRNELSAKKDNRMYWAGVSICNSETGKSAVWVKPYVRIHNVTDNSVYSILDKNVAGSTRFIHRGELDPERVKKAITDAVSAAQTGITQLMLTATQIVEKPAEVIRKELKSDVFPSRIISVLEEEYKDVETANRLQMTESILAAVKDLPVYEKYHAEAAAGRFVSLFENLEERIENILAEEMGE